MAVVEEFTVGEVVESLLFLDGDDPPVWYVMEFTDETETDGEAWE